MTRTYVSTVIPHPADTVWAMVKDFQEYRWGEGVGEATIENDLDSNTPGAIRRFAYYDRQSRQRLVTHSAEDRMQSWESVEAFDPTLSYYKATLRITPVTTSGSSFVEWWSDFEATAESMHDWQTMQQREFGKSLARLLAHSPEIQPELGIVGPVGNRGLEQALALVEALCGDKGCGAAD